MKTQPELWKDVYKRQLQSGWGGILAIAIVGPVLEELLFRGAITHALLQQYNPTKAILILSLIHIS